MYDDREWRPCTVLAWYRYPEPVREMMSQLTITWAVQLRTADGDQWWGFRPDRLRPAS